MVEEIVTTEIGEFLIRANKVGGIISGKTITGGLKEFTYEIPPALEVSVLVSHPRKSPFEPLVYYSLEKYEPMRDVFERVILPEVKKIIKTVTGKDAKCYFSKYELKCEVNDYSPSSYELEKIVMQIKDYIERHENLIKKELKGKEVKARKAELITAEDIERAEAKIYQTIRDVLTAKGKDENWFKELATPEEKLSILKEVAKKLLEEGETLALSHLRYLVSAGKLFKKEEEEEFW